MSGPVVDRQDVKPARAITDMAFRKKSLCRSDEHVLLVSRNAQFGQSCVLFAFGSRSYFDECQRRAVVTDQVNFTFGSSRHVVPRHKNISMPSQIPVGVSFAAHARSPSFVLLAFRRRALLFA